jgi:isopentenyl phosphate kinase
MVMALHGGGSLAHGVATSWARGDTTAREPMRVVQVRPCVVLAEAITSLAQKIRQPIEI